MPLYVVAIIKTDPETKEETLTLKPTPVLAKSEALAIVEATQVVSANGKEVDAQNSQIIVRPFCE